MSAIFYMIKKRLAPKPGIDLETFLLWCPLCLHRLAFEMSEPKIRTRTHLDSTKTTWVNRDRALGTLSFLETNEA